jgi:methionyl-tRNA formyltransferase
MPSGKLNSLRGSYGFSSNDRLIVTSLIVVEEMTRLIPEKLNVEFVEFSRVNVHPSLLPRPTTSLSLNPRCM